MIAFIHIEKTAGTTINRILRRSFGLSHCDVEPREQAAPYFSAADYAMTKKIWPRLVSIAGHGVKPLSDLETASPGIRYYTLLRNPLDRVISHYQNHLVLCGYSIDLGEWLQYDIHHNFQTRKLAGCDDLDKAIDIVDKRICFVGLLEKFDESMVMLRKHFGNPSLDIRYTREAVARNSEVKERLLNSPPQRALLEESNRLDAALYEYVKNTVYPRQQERYGPSLEADVRAFREGNRLGLADRIPEWMNFFYRQAVYKPLIKLYRRRHRLVTKKWPKG